jgi:uncharacterized membrane protein YqjE
MMNEESQREPQSPLAVGLFRSLGSLVASLVGIAHTRLELLTTELQEEVQRAAQLLLWAAVALLAGMLAVFLGALSVIFYFWETHRLLAALLITTLFAALAALAVGILFAKLRAKPPILEATLAELSRDREQLRGGV